jgi:hypothetical protein
MSRRKNNTTHTMKCSNLWVSAKRLTSIFIISSIGVDVDIFYTKLSAIARILKNILTFTFERKY